MKTRRNKKFRGFTVLEIMIAVSLIGILSTISLPTYINARKNSQVKAMVNNIRDLTDAIDQWALDYSKSDSEVPTFEELAPYLKGSHIPEIPLVGVTYQLNSLGSSNVVAYVGVPADYRPYVPELYQPQFGF